MAFLLSNGCKFIIIALSKWFLMLTEPRILRRFGHTPKPPQNTEFSVSQKLNLKALYCHNRTPF